MLLTIAKVVTKEDLEQSVGVVFEPTARLVERLLVHLPFESYTDLINVASMEIQKLDQQDRIEVVNAHPIIGANPSALSQASRKEQGSGDDIDVLERLAVLNAAYQDKFGFKFVVFVNGRAKRDLIPVLEQRMANSLNDELQAGLDAMMDIARDRLLKYQ